MSWDLSSEEAVVNKLEAQQKTLFAFAKKIKELEKKIRELEDFYGQESICHSETREKLSITIDALKLIAGNVEFYCSIGDHSKQFAAQETLRQIGEKSGQTFNA